MKTKLVIFAIMSMAMTQACSTWDKFNSTEKGAVIGGGSGALIGNAISPGVGGTVVGGGIGALGGGVIGHEIDEDDKKKRRSSL